MKAPARFTLPAVLAVLASFAGPARAEETKKVQLNPQPEPPGVTAATISTVSPGGTRSSSPAITKVTASASPVLARASIQFQVEGIGDCKRGRIDFGDTNMGSEYALVGGKGQPSPAHAYAKAGTYDVRVFGAADPWAKLPAPPPASQHACTGHASTQVVVKPYFVYQKIPVEQHSTKPAPPDNWSVDGKTPTPTPKGGSQ